MLLKQPPARCDETRVSPSRKSIGLLQIVTAGGNASGSRNSFLIRVLIKAFTWSTSERAKSSAMTPSARISPVLRIVSKRGSLQTFRPKQSCAGDSVCRVSRDVIPGPEIPSETGKDRACTRPILHDRFWPGAQFVDQNDMLLSYQPSRGALLRSLAPLPGGESP